MVQAIPYYRAIRIGYHFGFEIRTEYGAFGLNNQAHEGGKRFAGIIVFIIVLDVGVVIGKLILILTILLELIKLYPSNIFRTFVLPKPVRCVTGVFFGYLDVVHYCYGFQ